jgi:L-ribulose-5-phosphate 3-epimerase
MNTANPGKYNFEIMDKPVIKYSRRKFLGTMALAGATLPLTGNSVSNLIFSPPVTSRPIHVFSKPMQWLGYDALSDMLTEAGAEGIDLCVRPGGHVLPEKVESDLPKAMEAARKKGLKIDMIVTAITKSDEKYTEAILKTSSDLGIKFYRMGYCNYDESIGTWGSLQKVKPDFQKLAELNRKYKIHGAYQNHVGTRIGGPVWDLYELLKELDPEYIGCQYDVRHAVAEGGSSWINGFRLIIPWVKCTDIKDFKWSQINSRWNPESVPVGEGMVNFDEYFKLVKKYNVPGPISIHLEYPPFERFNKEISEAEKRKLFVTAMKKDIDTVKTYRDKYKL